MRSAAPPPGDEGPRNRRGTVVRRLLGWLLCLACLLPLPAAAQTGGIELAGFELFRGDDGLHLDYAVNFDLPRGAEEALNKSVPLYFVAEAELFRDRWYWRDKRVAKATRVWRIVFQPLTVTYRVTFAGFSQSYATRTEAFAAMRRGVHWKIAEESQIEGSGHYVEFSFRLDTSLLPRPMQIGIGNPADWDLAIEKTQRLD
ncbi:MAG: DUF4390 domain-containing protein [Piscinibacter sp.]|nr:DUF4390 domain-containing protein [Piscinibacter sp.]